VAPHGQRPERYTRREMFGRAPVGPPWRGTQSAPRCSSSPLRTGQALRRRSFAPVGSHVRTYHPASGTHRFRAQVSDRRVIRPTIRFDCRAVVAKPGGAIDQQPPAPMRAHVAERNRRASIGLLASPRRWVVMGVAIAHPVSSGFGRPIVEHRRADRGRSPDSSSDRLAPCQRSQMVRQTTYPGVPRS
jgi:hypothetical protein